MHTVDELMTTDVITVNITDLLGPVRDRMAASHVHAAPVLDDTGELVGIVTSSDFLAELAPPVGVLSVMTLHVVTCGPHTPIIDAARTMVERRVHHLVVTQRDHLVGMLSSFDVMRHLAGRVESLAPSTPAPHGLHADVGDVIVVRPRHHGERERRATVVCAHGEDGTGPFTVRWSDDLRDDPRQSLYFPSTDTYVERAPVRG